MHDLECKNLRGYKDKSAWFIYSPAEASALFGAAGAECEMRFARFFLVIRDIGCQLVNRMRLGQKT